MINTKRIRKSLISGAATVLDITGGSTKARVQLPPEVIDAAAIRSDWEAVGADIRSAIAHMKEDTPSIKISINR